MTNKERQASLEKKNGMTGNAPYCYFCNFQLGYIKGCRFKNNTTEKTPCATAYNRMRRS